MAKSAREQKGSLGEVILQMGALNSYNRLNPENAAEMRERKENMIFKDNKIIAETFFPVKLYFTCFAPPRHTPKGAGAKRASPFPKDILLNFKTY